MHLPESGPQPLGPDWFRPLGELIPRIPDLDPFQHFDPDDFRVMGRVLRHPAPDVTLYKHVSTGRYLNLDEEGNTYRYAGPPLESFRSGEYRRQDLVAALRALGLGDLPRLKVMPGPSSSRARPDDELAPRRASRVRSGTAQARPVSRGRRDDGGRGHLRSV